MLYGISPSLLPQPADWPSNAWSFITAGPGRRIPLLVRAYLRSFCLSQQISSSGPSSYASEALRRLRGASITSRPPPILAARTAEMREQASAVGEKMRAENGLAAAVGRVHALTAS
jgi:hypothetical protein